MVSLMESQVSDAGKMSLFTVPSDFTLLIQLKNLSTLAEELVSASIMKSSGGSLVCTHTHVKYNGNISECTDNRQYLTAWEERVPAA